MSERSESPLGDDTDHADAVAGLTQLGLSTYEAKVFVGLHALGTGSAGEVAEVTDVPRSQVYGAAEGLEELGLIDVQAGTPTRYRPLPVSEARYLLFERMKEAGDTAFDYVDSVAGTHADDDDSGEAVWRTDGGENVAQRAAAMVDAAERQLTYGAADVSRIGDAVLTALSEADARGVDVRVASADPAVRAAATDTGVTAVGLAETATPDLSNGRVLVADERAVLLSVLPGAVPHVSTETAFWSDDTAFARILVTLIGEWFAEHLET
ncbi:TrmB family transcriptional regulator [Halobaculum sp. MBLA0143]|uniref:TrmB family transcriptional regulator n=1 Tax=Halobaculum sp. MBLA0143 TaxID=3079933 RepID=UPI00352382D7